MVGPRYCGDSAAAVIRNSTKTMCCINITLYYIGAYIIIMYTDQEKEPN